MAASEHAVSEGARKPNLLTGTASPKDPHYSVSSVAVLGHGTDDRRLLDSSVIAYPKVTGSLETRLPFADLFGSAVEHSFEKNGETRDRKVLHYSGLVLLVVASETR